MKLTLLTLEYDQPHPRPLYVRYADIFREIARDDRRKAAHAVKAAKAAKRAISKRH